MPFPLSLIASGLVFAVALVLLWLAVGHWRRAARIAPTRDHRIVITWRLPGTAYAL